MKEGLAVMLRKRNKGTDVSVDVVCKTTAEFVVIDMRSKLIGVRLIEGEAISVAERRRARLSNDAQFGNVLARKPDEQAFKERKEWCYEGGGRQLLLACHSQGERRVCAEFPRLEMTRLPDRVSRLLGQRDGESWFRGPMSPQASERRVRIEPSIAKKQSQSSSARASSPTKFHRG